METLSATLSKPLYLHVVEKEKEKNWSPEDFQMKELNDYDSTVNVVILYSQAGKEWYNEITSAYMQVR